MNTAIDLVMLIVSITLILVILLQTKGSSFSGAFGGDSGSIYRTRRGVEKTLFQFTVGLAVVFLIIAIITSIVSG
ncbi:MAG: preprotein translocase subunit SecG [Chloroflexota bacterium]|nr:preprotein translocase subunit SecG [Chloroflexota bacterium]MDP9473646.1 preprotein translocase subunit SecG [Chloroflexota bacterium]